MNQWKLWLVQLLPLCWCYSSEVTLVKTIGPEPDVTPVCTSETLNNITLIVCKIRTERNGTEECSLLYQHGQDFVHECDPRFTLMEENEAVFLHLTSLTPVDSGNYTCECSHPGGTDTLHLIITVEASNELLFIILLTPMFYFIVIGPAAFLTVVVSGIVLGCVLRNKHSRDDTRSSPCETPCSLGQYHPDDPDDPYMSLQNQESDLYHTTSSIRHEDDTKRNPGSNNILTEHLDNQEVDGSETAQDREIYENL